MNGSAGLALLQSHYINSVSLVYCGVWRGPAEDREGTDDISRGTTCVRRFVLCFFINRLPAEVLSAYSCTLLNKAWTLTFGVQSPSQNVTPMD